MQDNAKKAPGGFAAGHSGLVEATTNLILLAAVVLIGSMVATTVVGVCLKYVDFGGENLGDFSETDVRSPGLIAFYFGVDVANSSFDGEESKHVILTGQGYNEIWVEAAKDWSDDVPPLVQSDRFAVLLAGYLWCPTPLNITLQVNADGPVWVWVDNEPAVSMLAPSTTLHLSAGYHTLKVKYASGGSGIAHGFELLWDATGQLCVPGEGDIFY